MSEESDLGAWQAERDLHAKLDAMMLALDAMLAIHQGLPQAPCPKCEAKRKADAQRQAKRRAKSKLSPEDRALILNADSGPPVIVNDDGSVSLWPTWDTRG